MNIKKIVAREGLILLSLTILNFLAGIILYFWAWNQYSDNVSKNPGSYVGPPAPAECLALTSCILFGAWIIYLIVRFYVWAIKTLKAKG